MAPAFQELTDPVKSTIGFTSAVVSKAEKLPRLEAVRGLAARLRFSRTQHPGFSAAARSSTLLAASFRPEAVMIFFILSGFVIEA